MLLAVTPTTGSAGDIFTRMQFQIHGGAIGGFWGRVFISAIGIMVTVLAVTGVLIWRRKRVARRRGACGRFREATEARTRRISAKFVFVRRL